MTVQLSGAKCSCRYWQPWEAAASSVEKPAQSNGTWAGSWTPVLLGALLVILTWSLSAHWMLRATPLLPEVAELGATDSTLGASVSRFKIATSFLTDIVSSVTAPACQGNHMFAIYGA